MKTLAAIALIATLSGCTIHIDGIRGVPTPLGAVHEQDYVRDAGIISESATGGLVINDAAYVRYSALLGRFSDKLTPAVRQHDGSPQAVLQAAKGNTWTLSREGVALWLIMQRWERTQR